jgi:DNA helicase II / ATP-dependent DNA helicase PcrA
MQYEKSFKNFLENNLNPEQKKAVEQKNGSLLVIAGAGSGKTRVITSRIINLIINERINPESIVALTFTNKAAREMKERIIHFLGAQAEKTFIGTFHSYCLNLLRTHAEFIPFSSFSILDADDQQQLLHNIIKRSNLQKKITAKNLGYQISIRKNSVLEQQGSQQDALFEELFRVYEYEKSLSKSFDFDDLLLEVLKLSNNVLFKRLFQERIRHILVDEYQDTNLVQHELLKHMALAEKKFAIDSLCAVGDEDQSIYSWRGATVANIMHFKNDFPNTTMIKIEQNYRSVQPILTIANHVIQNNQQRNPKKLWSERTASNRACIFTCLSGYQEGEAIAQSLKTAQSKKWSSLAVLYRAHYQSRIIEESLLRNAIAYKIVGGIQFYERKEIKDILAYVRLAVNPFDRISFFRVINTPSRGLGEKFEQEFQMVWQQQPLFTFHDVINHMIDTQLITGKKAQQLKEFSALFKKISYNDKPTDCINHIIYETDYYAYLKDNFEEKEAEVKIENIKELLRAAKHFEEREPHNTVALFLHEIALIQEKINDQESADKKVYLMTLHSAKGLEFDMVILSGLEEGMFPSAHALYESETVEEERRLFYVGITRAKEYLLITHARYRYTFGSMSDQRPSRFLAEIPESLAQKHDISQWSVFEMSTFFVRWFGNEMHNQASSIITFGTATKSKQDTKEQNVINKEFSVKTYNKKTDGFKKFQSVQHTKFGIGIIQEVEQKDEDTIYITAKFKSGVKKVKADFLEKV